MGDKTLKEMQELREFVVTMNNYEPLRIAVSHKFEALYKDFVHYTTTKSKYCPRVYLTCERIIKQINERRLNSEFKTIVSCYNRAEAARARKRRAQA